MSHKRLTSGDRCETVLPLRRPLQVQIRVSRRPTSGDSSSVADQLDCTVPRRAGKLLLAKTVPVNAHDLAFVLEPVRDGPTLPENVR